MTLILLLRISWLCGWLIVRTALGRSIKSWLEDTILQRTPIFQTYQKVTGQTAPAASKSASPVLVLVNGDWQPAVVTETAANGWSTVFVPDIPLIKSGRLYCFPGEQVRKLNCSLTDFKKQLAVVGRGSQDWLEKVTESKN